MERAREVLSEPFKYIFDEPWSRPTTGSGWIPGTARARSTRDDYHIALEGTLGIVTSHFLLDLLRT